MCYIWDSSLESVFWSQTMVVTSWVIVGKLIDIFVKYLKFGKWIESVVDNKLDLWFKLGFHLGHYDVPLGKMLSVNCLCPSTD